MSDDTAAYGPDFELDKEPKDAKPWLALIEDAEKGFRNYQDAAQRIEKAYGDLDRLAAGAKAARLDAEFQLFWANVQVLAPSIYAKPPVPVVSPKFKDRRPLYQTSAEMLERCTIVSFDLGDINATMMHLRDALVIVGRGSPWVRYEEAKGQKPERVCYDYVDREDFLHDPARTWEEVGWAARRAWLTRKEMRERFKDYSGDLYKDADYSEEQGKRKRGDKSSGLIQKAGVWEIWHKAENKVVWVAAGCEEVLDENPPHLKLEGFFPCPRPAYATTQPRSLIPLPDALYYHDQLVEVNKLTARIHTLAEAVKVKGFYPAGSGEIANAVETAVASIDDTKMMIPVANYAAFGGQGKVIEWLPIDMIVSTIAQLVELRRQVIDDVYQIVGLSDIMRGATEASETATAQQIKAQYGSVRIRDKVAELVRVARDMAAIGAEIMAEEFGRKTLLEMSQLDLPTDAQIERDIKALRDQARAMAAQQVEQMLADPEILAQAQANPQAAQMQAMEIEAQALAQVEPQIAKLRETPTQTKVIAFLRDNKLRPFVMDIETDSTIQADEAAEKERRAAFTAVLGTTMAQLGELVAAQPGAAKLAGEILKFAIAPYRAGRQLDGAIDEFVENLQAQPQQQGDPQAEAEAQKIQAEEQRDQRKFEMEAEKTRMEVEGKVRIAQAEGETKTVEANAKLQEIAARREEQREKHTQDMQRGAMEIEALTLKNAALKFGMVNDAQSAAINAASAEQQTQIREREAASRERPA